MGTTLVVNELITWMPTFWIFRQTLRLIAEHLDDQMLAEWLREPADESRFPYLSLSSLEPEQFNKVLNAACQAFNRMLSVDTRPEIIPSGYFFVYMFHFSQLKALLLLDSRVVQTERRVTIIIRENVQWQAAAWTGDLVLEAMATYSGIQQYHQELAENIIAARGNKGSGVLDLCSISGDVFCCLREPIVWAYQYYGNGPVRISKAEEFYTALAPQVIQLHALIMADRRVENCGPLPEHLQGE